jgi:acetyltransferase, GNAT family
MIVLELEFLQRSDECSSPYPCIENFDERWWNDDCHFRDLADLGDEFDFIQLRGGGEILGRAMLSDAQPGDHYVGAPLEMWGKEICFFEIRQDRRRYGYGTEFIRMLCKHYCGSPLFAYAIDEATEFWTSLGWNRYDVIESERGSFSPLFLYQNKPKI